MKIFIESSKFQTFIIVLIVLNAITLGLETVQGLPESLMGFLHVFDKIALAIFCVELLMKIFVYRISFIKDPWNVFDFIVVSISLVPASGNLSVIRAFRVLRVLRLVSSMPSLRFVVNTFLKALPGIGAVALLFSIVFYVFTVISTKLFAVALPHYFGNLGATMFSLFQLMTLDNWTAIVNEASAVYSWSSIYFIFYILVSTFILLNMVIAVVVSVMDEEVSSKNDDDKMDKVLKEVRSINRKLAKKMTVN